MSRADWLANRRKGIGASDAPAIMGVSPYKTAIQIWEDKTSTEAPVELSSRIMEKGNELEPIARKQFAAHYNLLNDADETFEPLLVQLAEFPFMKASLDGASKDQKTIVEIKHQGKEGHLKIAKEGKLKDAKEVIRIDYWTQMQHQFICSEATKGYLVSINEDCDPKVTWMEVKPDYEYHKIHFRTCVEFWDCVENKIRPGVTEDDFVLLKGLDKEVEEWKRVKLSIEVKEKLLEELRKKILDKVNHPKMHACGVTICQVDKAGSVDYKKIPELKGVDLEKYRKAPSKYYKFDIK